MIFQLRSLQAAFVLFSRLPLASEHLQAAHFAAASRYLFVVGLVIGGISAASFALAQLYFSSFSASLIALIIAIIISGAMHEDGLADCADALFLPHKTDKLISIMKDSRLGTFAVLALISVFSLKLAFVNDIQAEKQLLALFLLQPMARISPLWIMHYLPKLQSPDSKITQQLQGSPAAIGQSLAALALLLLLCPINLSLLIIAAVMLSTYCCRHFFQRKLQAYNGDCLGFSEQMAELSLLLVFAAYF